MVNNLTRSGVCYNLKLSPFFEDYAGYRFYFSSETHRRNFYLKAHIKEEWLSDSLSRRFHFDIDAGIIAVFQLYMHIETRGFYVVSESGEKLTTPKAIAIKAVM